MTAQEIENVKPGRVLWDVGSEQSVKGLHIRAFPSGRKVFYLYYRSAKGDQRKPKLGDYGVLSISDAREIASAMLIDVAKGFDPSVNRRQAKGELTVDELFKKTWAGHWSAEQFQKSRHAKEVERNYENHVKYRFGAKRLSEITAADVREWHAGFKATPYAGNRSLSVLSTMFEFAERMEWRLQNTNPCRLVKPHEERKRERYATTSEMAALGQSLSSRASAFPQEVAFLYLLIYTGSRPSAIERATWADLKDGVLEIDGKTGREKIHLPPQALDILATLPQNPGPIAGRFPRKLWEEIRLEAGCKDLWARDWRRTFATVALSSGHNPTVIGELLNHASAQTDKIYAKLMSDARASVAAATAAKLSTYLTRDTGPSS